jgi:uncharacterized membrane protein (DUF106 family)
MFESYFALLDTIFLPVTNLPPFLSIAIFAIFSTLLVTFILKIFERKKVRAEIMKRLEEIREKLTVAQRSKNSEETERLIKELLSINKEYLKHSLKLILISFLIVLIFLPWLNFKYRGTAAAILPFSLPVLGSKLPWFYWYAFVSLVISWLIKKFID